MRTEASSLEINFASTLPKDTMRSIDENGARWSHKLAWSPAVFPAVRIRHRCIDPTTVGRESIPLYLERFFRRIESVR
jgi:hypothetical protein